MKFIMVVLRMVVVGWLGSAVLAGSLIAQNNSAPASGEAVFRDVCATCHGATASDRVPTLEDLRRMSPDTVVDALTNGPMRDQGMALTVEARRAVAEFVTAKSLTASSESAAARCAQTAAWSTTGPAWNGWSPEVTNTRFQPGAPAGLATSLVPRLTPRWAFGFPRTSSLNAPPSVVGGRLFMPSANRLLYALDAASGCEHWSFETEAPVRAATVVATPPAAGKPLVFLADTRAVVYAVDAATGQLVWRKPIDNHPRASVRGAVAYFDGRLFIPVTAAEEGLTPNDDYECCTARGSLVALDAATGRLLWKTYTIEAEPRPVGKTTKGTAMWGPSGASIWSAPTIDAERRLVYAATGNNFSKPATATSNAVIAFDVANGRMVWVKQLVSDDVWNNACLSNAANCPEGAGPDHDIAAPPMLVTRADGKRFLLIGQKSGVAWGLDPDRRGEVVWRTQVGQGIPVFGSILFGIATDGEKMYVAIGDLAYVDPSVPAARRQLDPKKGGGLRALDVATGRTIWSAPAPTCDRPNCSPAQVAPISVMPGVVFAGAMDGRVRAYSAMDGKVVWEFDTARPFETVNGVSAEGGSTRPTAPLVVGGVLYVGAGPRGGTAGSVLVAFGTQPPQGR